MKNKCLDCGCELPNENHKFCSRCLAQWHVENNIDDDTPCGDWDDDGGSMHGPGEY